MTTDSPAIGTPVHTLCHCPVCVCGVRECVCKYVESVCIGVCVCVCVCERESRCV